MANIRLIKFRRDNPTQIQYTYNVPNMASFSYDLNSPVTPTPLPEEGAADNVLIKMEGNSSKIALRWRVKNFEESLVNETNVRTLKEQLLFFRNEFIPTGIEDSYRFLINFDDNDTLDLTANTLFFDGTFTKFRFDTSSSAPVTFQMSMDFLEGTIASVHDIDVPSEPLNVSSFVSGSTVTLNWAVPRTEDDITITGYRIRYRRIEIAPSDWTTISGISHSTRSQVINNLADDTYLFELTPISTFGAGKTARESAVVDTS